MCKMEKLCINACKFNEIKNKKLECWILQIGQYEKSKSLYLNRFVLHYKSPDKL